MNKLRSHVASKELKESLATFKYVYIYIYIYMYIYIYIINKCLHVHVPTNIDTFKHACILHKHTCIHISIRTYIVSPPTFLMVDFSTVLSLDRLPPMSFPLDS